MEKLLKVLSDLLLVPTKGHTDVGIERELNNVGCERITRTKYSYNDELFEIKLFTVQLRYADTYKGMTLHKATYAIKGFQIKET